MKTEDHSFNNPFNSQETCARITNKWQVWKIGEDSNLHYTKQIGEGMILKKNFRLIFQEFEDDRQKQLDSIENKLKKNSSYTFYMKVMNFLSKWRRYVMSTDNKTLGY